MKCSVATIQRIAELTKTFVLAIHAYVELPLRARPIEDIITKLKVTKQQSTGSLTRSASSSRLAWRAPTLIICDSLCFV
jgi:transposase